MLPYGRGARRSRANKVPERMEDTLNVLINGIAGVFCGMAILYVAMKLIRVVAGRDEAKEE